MKHIGKTKLNEKRPLKEYFSSKRASGSKRVIDRWDSICEPSDAGIWSQTKLNSAVDESGTWIRRATKSGRFQECVRIRSNAAGGLPTDVVDWLEVQSISQFAVKDVE